MLYGKKYIEVYVSLLKILHLNLHLTQVLASRLRRTHVVIPDWSVRFL